MTVAPLDWLIVGGGIHGTYLSHVLLHRAGVSRDRLRVVDPHEEPLSCWDRFTRNTGMQYLRSPAVHHLDFHPQGLARFAKKGLGRKVARFVPPYQRPGLALFRAHTASLIEEHGLREVRLACRATGLGCRSVGLRVETSQGSLEAKNVVLALGLSEQPCVPAWAKEAMTAGARIDHLFDGSFRTEYVAPTERVVVVGGGITSAQVALALTRQGGRVTLVTRHALRKHRFDSDPGWLGPRNMMGFARTSDLSARRRLIREARNRGSVPPEIYVDLKRALETRTLARVEDDILRVVARETGDLGVELAGGETVIADRVLLATGFEAHRPGGRWLDEAIHALGLSCAECGYPVVDQGLRWLAKAATPYPLFVSGPLAELELGPSARNIIGARNAGERLVGAA